MASLKDIASDLGVSHALVSRVLNNRMGTTRVSERTRLAIIAKAKELDYEPNPLAVALKKGRKGAVGLFIHSVGVEGSELSARFIQSAGRVLSEAGLNLWLQFFGTAEEFQAVCNQKLTRKIDGLIVAGLAHHDLIENLLAIESKELPVVAACHGEFMDSGIVNFQTDEVAQCELATQHLLELGCRRIAHISKIPRRLEGYQKALRAAGLQPDPDLVLEAEDFSAQAGENAMRDLLARGVEYDGIVAQSDSLAVGALKHLNSLGVRPADFPKITGVDDSPIAEFYSLVPLTSATQEIEACARLAVAGISGKLAGEEVQSQLVQPRLIIRESTVGPRN